MKKIKTDETQLWHWKNTNNYYTQLQLDPNVKPRTGEHEMRWRRSTKWLFGEAHVVTIGHPRLKVEFKINSQLRIDCNFLTNLKLLVGVQATNQIVIWQWGSKPFGKLKFVLNWLVTLNREILRRNRSKNISFIVDNRSASIAYEIKLLKMSGQTFKFATYRQITIYDLQKMRYAKCELGWTRRS